TQQHSLFQAGNGLGKDQEILITGLAQGSPVAIGMLVYDIVTDADMYRDWHSEANPGSQYAQVLVRERTLPNGSPQRFAEADAGFRTGSDGIVHPSGFFPEPELAGADVPRYTLRAGADQGEFPIMDRSGAVHGNVIEEAALHQL